MEGNTTICEADSFNERADAIDFIDFHIIDRIEGLLCEAAPAERLDALMQRARQLKDRLTRIDTELFGQLRRAIAAGKYPPQLFRQMVGGYFVGIGKEDTAGYDNLDVFINCLLNDRDLPEPTIALLPEMVFYQKTPARIIFELAERTHFAAGDVFFDIGSGLGQVAILMNLLSGAAARGVEYEPAYCNYATACAAQLNLTNVTFINGDALVGDYSQGTVFFIYTSFQGAMLQRMLDILQKEAVTRAIWVFTYGPCSAHVAAQHWLQCVNGDGSEVYRLYEFAGMECH